MPLVIFDASSIDPERFAIHDELFSRCSDNTRDPQGIYARAQDVPSRFNRIFQSLTLTKERK